MNVSQTLASLFTFLVLSSLDQWIKRSGLHDDFLSIDDWRDIDPNGNTIPSVIDGEEMAMFRDDAGDGITTRLAATKCDDYYGKGEICSAGGLSIKVFSSTMIRF